MALPIKIWMKHYKKSSGPVTNLYSFESAKTNDKNFLITFQQTFPELYQKLLKLNTELTPNDIELCAFLKLNIQTKEIALYKKSSIGSVDNRKYRLRKKLNLTSKPIYIYGLMNCNKIILSIQGSAFYKKTESS
jgi:DNA-binding CsgD family transcriptional regulator